MCDSRNNLRSRAYRKINHKSEQKPKSTVDQHIIKVEPGIPDKLDDIHTRENKNQVINEEDNLPILRWLILHNTHLPWDYKILFVPLSKKAKPTSESSLLTFGTQNPRPSSIISLTSRYIGKSALGIGTLQSV